MKAIDIIKISRHWRGVIGCSARALAMGTWLAAGTALAAPPINDDFANAIELAGESGIQTGTGTAGAALQPGEPDPGAFNTVWFKWTCAADGALTVSTTGSAKTADLPGEWDAILGIYSGAELKELTPLDMAPKDTVFEETMTVEVTVGNTYYIQLAGFGNEAAGNILLNWNLVATSNRANILAFGPGAAVSQVVGDVAFITWTVPFGTNRATLAPTFALSPGATCTVGGLPVVSGGTVDLTGPVVYTVTAQGASPIINRYFVLVTFALDEAALYWERASGDWDYNTFNWLGFTSATDQPFSDGLNVIFEGPFVGTINITEPVSPLTTLVSAASGSYTFIGQSITSGSLTKDGGGTLQILGVVPHTYSGGTVINGGRLVLGGLIGGISPDIVNPIGAGRVTLNAGTLELQRVKAANALTVNGGTLLSNNGWGATWSGPVVLNASATIDATWSLIISGNITGSGGFTKTGPNLLTLSGTNSYTGPTTVTGGTLQAKKLNALGSGALIISTGGAKVNLSYSGSKNIAALSLGGVAQPGGTHGSSASPATFKSDTYFSGTGTVTVSEAVLPDFFFWADAASGDWSKPANWTNEVNPAIVAAPLSGGRRSYSLTFDVAGTYTATNNLSAGFMLNQLNLGAAVSLDKNGLAFVAKGRTLPTINQNSGSEVSIANELELGSDTTFGGPGSGQVNLSGLISGAGGLIKDGPGTLRVYNENNSFAGGTVINGGTLWGDIDAKLGTGPITLNGGVLFMWRFKPKNALIVNGGSITSENGFNQNVLAGPVTLNATLVCDAPWQLTCSDTISGAGGLTKNGAGNMILSNTSFSTYTGPTTVTGGTLQCDSTNALSGSSALSIGGSGKLNLNYAGTKAVASLTLGGVVQTTPGTYGSVASGATFPNDTFFKGNGTVTIVAGGSDYGTWLTGFTFAQGGDTTPAGDPDGDRVTNEMEYAFGLNPTLGSSVNPIIQPLDPITGNFQYTRRAKPAATKLVYTVRTSSILGDWATGGATETGFTTAGEVETVTVNVTAPAVGGKLFVRVDALPAP